MKKHKRELKFDATMKAILPPGMHPLEMIIESGCDNDCYELSEDAKRMVCKYGYCANIVCIEAS